MRNNKVKKIIIIVSFVVIILVAAGISLGILNYRTNRLADDYTFIYNDERYATPVFLDDVDVIKQDISCGYAVIEMFAAWAGKDITEESLYSEYGKVVTSTGKSFCREMNMQFSDHKTTMHKYLTDAELIKKVYTALSSGYPVPFEWAAKYEDEWTLHYSLITGMDIAGDKVVIANPYGYYEEISIDEFVKRTTYEAYSDMPLFIKLAFAVGIFEKNTIFVVE